MLNKASKPTRLAGFFYALFLGNLSSKLLLVASDAIAVLFLTKEGFGAFSFLQGLILSGAVISVWGADQGIISVVGRSESRKVCFSSYLDKSRKKVSITSLIVVIAVLMIVSGSKVKVPVSLQIISGILIVLEAQLILNSAFLRAVKKPYKAVMLLDGIRHLFLFLASIYLIFFNGNYAVLISFWLASAVISFVLGHSYVAKESNNGGSLDVSIEDIIHAKAISKFSGAWSVTQFSISRLIIIVSAYLLAADELGIIAFFMKLLVAFTFLQTVMVQAVAPVIGSLSKKTDRGPAKQLYRTSTFFLAAFVPPAIGLAVINIGPLSAFFDMPLPGSAWIVYLLFMSHALNIGTGIVGQFIIHFGYARQLFFISVLGALLQLILLLGLGKIYGAPGVLMAYALSTVFLVLAKNAFAAVKIQIHGFHWDSLTLVATAWILSAAVIVGYPISNELNLGASFIYLAIYLSVIGAVAITLPSIKSLIRRAA